MLGCAGEFTLWAHRADAELAGFEAALITDAPTLVRHAFGLGAVRTSGRGEREDECEDREG